MDETKDDPLETLVVLPFSSGPADDRFDFKDLKLVEKPDSPQNSHSLPQTLEGCEGYLEKLPLKEPNVDQRKPQTIADMINILTDPDAVAAFELEMESKQNPDEGSRFAGNDTGIYDYNSSEIMIEQLASSMRSTSHWETCIGHICRPGCISLYNKDGKTYAVSEGCWVLTPFRANWIWGWCNIGLDQAVIQPQGKQVLIVRVLTGEVGLVVEQGRAKLLDTGTHVYNSGTVRIRRKQSYSESNFFSHGPYNYVRVPRGMCAKVWAEVANGTSKSLVPRLLKEGEHYCESVLFKFDGLVDASDPYIRHGSVHVISVPKGHVAKVFHDQKPRLLGEGVHVIESVQCEYVGMENIITSPCIVHGTITILRVTRGEVGLAWRNNEPIFIDQPGLFEFDSEDFQFVGFKRADERLIELGAKKVIQVYTGEVGVTYEQGELRVLQNGRHVIDSSTHVFERFLSTKQKSIRLVTLCSTDRASKNGREEYSKEKERRARRATEDSESDLIICDTKDLVKIGVRADVFYSIKDTEKCIRNIDPAELEDLVRETAVATLTNIIRSTALNQIAQSKHVSASGVVGGQEGLMPSSLGEEAGLTGLDRYSNAAVVPPSAPMFFERAHDEFMNKLHDDFMQRYGVDIANIRMESFKIMDTELSYQISKQALTTAQVENELANLDGQSQILTQKERTAAEVQNINAQAEAQAQKTRIDSDNQRKIEAAQAEAEALKIARKAEAEAESSAILMKARAEAEAAEAEAEALKIATRAKAEAESEAVLMKAKAEAEAIRMKAMAESERAQVLSQTELGQQECLLGIYSDMVKQSNQGVEKVVYLDSSVNRQSPFALGSLVNLNQDLHSLSQVGIAANMARGLDAAVENDGVAPGE